MCGRFQLSVKGKEISERFLTELFDELHRPPTPDARIPKGYNCAPLQWLPVISNAAPGSISHYRWGLVPSWARDTSGAPKMINSRAETVREKPAFRKAFVSRRCLVPANGFYEWKKSTGQPYRFFLKDEPLFAMAGLWEQWVSPDGTRLFTFSILTTEANALMQDVHHRMPVILPRHAEQVWLRSSDEETLFSLLRPYPEQDMEMYPVSKAVNNVRNDDERLIRPEPLQETLFG
ncbi:MAG TPA: SOS response-associated peptidase [Bacteroidales bacterium]|nr:SOS response-associated peptidase [Bacteroidales bacterium]